MVKSGLKYLKDEYRRSASVRRHAEVELSGHKHYLLASMLAHLSASYKMAILLTQVDSRVRLCLRQFNYHVGRCRHVPGTE